MRERKYSKSTKIEILFIMREMNNKWKTNFPQKVPLAFKTLILMSFQLVKAPLKILLITWEAAPLYFFKCSSYLKFYSSGKSFTELGVVCIKSVAFAQLCVFPKTVAQKVYIIFKFAVTHLDGCWDSLWIKRNQDCR